MEKLKSMLIKKENVLYIDVKDNGMGIPEEQIDGLLKEIANIEEKVVALV